MQMKLLEWEIFTGQMLFYPVKSSYSSLSLSILMAIFQVNVG